MPAFVVAGLSATEIGYYAAVATALPVLLVAYAVQVNGLMRLGLRWRLLDTGVSDEDRDEITEALAQMIARGAERSRSSRCSQLRGAVGS